MFYNGKIDKLEILFVELKNISNKSDMFADCISLEKFMKFNYNQYINKRLISEYKEKYESIDNNNLYNILNNSNESSKSIQSTFSLLDIPTYFLKSFVEEDNNIK